MDQRDRRYGRSIRQEFLIRWKTFTEEHDTWEPSSAVQEGAPQVVDAWNLLLARRDRRDRRGLEVPGGSTRRRGLQGSR